MTSATKLDQDLRKKTCLDMNIYSVHTLQGVKGRYGC